MQLKSELHCPLLQDASVCPASYCRVNAELWKLEPPSTFTVESRLSSCFYCRSLFRWPKHRLGQHSRLRKDSAHSSSVVPCSHSGHLASLGWLSWFGHLSVNSHDQVQFTHGKFWPSRSSATKMTTGSPGDPPEDVNWGLLLVSLCPPSYGHISVQTDMDAEFVVLALYRRGSAI